MKNHLKVAAWSGIAVIIFGIISGTIGTFAGDSWSYISVIISTALSVTFTSGFFVLGKKYNQKLVKNFAIYFIVLSIVMMVLMFFMLPKINSFVHTMQSFQVSIDSLSEQYGEDNIPQEEMTKLFPMEEYFPMLMKWLLVFYVGYVVLFGIPSILFGIGLMKLSRKVELAKATGILRIVGGATTVIFVGALVLGVSYGFEIIILYKEAAKANKKR